MDEKIVCLLIKNKELVHETCNIDLFKTSLCDSQSSTNFSIRLWFRFYLLAFEILKWKGIFFLLSVNPQLGAHYFDPSFVLANFWACRKVGDKNSDSFWSAKTFLINILCERFYFQKSVGTTLQTSFFCTFNLYFCQKITFWVFLTRFFFCFEFWSVFFSFTKLWRNKRLLISSIIKNLRNFS